MTRLQTIVTHLAMEAPLPVASGEIVWPDGINFQHEPSIALADYRALRYGRAALALGQSASPR